RVFDGVTFQPLAGPLGQFQAFGNAYTGGIFVAAGDMNGDAFADIIVGRGLGTPTVKVYSGADGSLLGKFKAYDLPTTIDHSISTPPPAGARVAAADTDKGVGFDEIIVGTGPGIANKVRVFSFINGAATLLRSFQPFAKTYQGGVFV